MLQQLGSGAVNSHAAFSIDCGHRRSRFRSRLIEIVAEIE